MCHGLMVKSFCHGPDRGDRAELGELGIVRNKRMLNWTLEIGHAGGGCAQSQGPELDEDRS